MSGAPLTIGTAGHVDHGKTALVRALTGRDTDRLPEERARGLSIAPGFAPLDLPSGRRVSLVDVPGHERFVRHMVAGASGVDAYLLVVAADDGVMPQTREHLAVLRLLGVRDGVVAVTKCDRMHPQLAADEARELVGDGPEVVPVAALDGAGLPGLLAALDRLAAGLGRRTAPGPARLFVDRAFTVPGAGTVATGTLWGAPLARGEGVVVLPGGDAARIRGVQRHDEAVERATGGRVALNLAGLPRDRVPRGACVVREGDGWPLSTCLDGELCWLPDAGGPLRTGRRLQVFLGTAEVPATVVLLDDEAVEPGGRGYAQLRLERPVPAAPGDRLVLRSAARRPVGGAEVVEVAAPRHGRGSGAARRLHVLHRGDPAGRAALLAREAGPRGLPAHAVDAGAARSAGLVALPGGLLLDPALARAARDALRAGLTPGPMPLAAARRATGLGERAADGLIALAVAGGDAVRDDGRLAAPGAAPREDPAAAPLAVALAGAGLRGLTTAEAARAAGVPPAAAERTLAGMREEGRAVPAQDLWLDPSVAAGAVDRAAAALAEGPMTIAALRDVWGVGRRHALALAAHLDAVGVTRRQGDLRVLRRGARAHGAA